MGRTALYRDPVPVPLARAEIRLDFDALIVKLPDGRVRRHALDGAAATTGDAYVARGIIVQEAHAAGTRVAARLQRRFVRMLTVECAGWPRGSAPGWSAAARADRFVLITPPDRGAVAPNVVHLPEAPSEAAIVDEPAWEVVADWLLDGGRLAACSIADLARLATIATSQFAGLLGEVAGQRALELVSMAGGPLRGGWDLDTALQPLTDAAQASPRAADALVAALAYTAGARHSR